MANYLCPRCGETDGVVLVSGLTDEGDAVLNALHSCAGQDDDYGWQVPDDSTAGKKASQAAKASLNREGTPLVQQLELYPKLLDAVSRFDRWVEYGAVEYEFALAHPEIYRQLVDRMGHLALGTSTNWSVSAYLARMLGNLTRTGELVYRPTAGTGRWSYDTEISSWRLPSVPDEAPLLTWKAYAEANSISSDRWPVLEDHVTATGSGADPEDVR